jgi:hypothetical protein
LKYLPFFFVIYIQKKKKKKKVKKKVAITLFGVCGTATFPLLQDFLLFSSLLLHQQPEDGRGSIFSSFVLFFSFLCMLFCNGDYPSRRSEWAIIC